MLGHLHRRGYPSDQAQAASSRRAPGPQFDEGAVAKLYPPAAARRGRLTGEPWNWAMCRVATLGGRPLPLQVGEGGLRPVAASLEGLACSLSRQVGIDPLPGGCVGRAVDCATLGSGASRFEAAAATGVFMRMVADEVLRRDPLTVEPLPSGTSVSVQLRDVDKLLVPHRRLVSPRSPPRDGWEYPLLSKEVICCQGRIAVRPEWAEQP